MKWNGQIAICENFEDILKILKNIS